MNDSDYGLTAAICSADAALAERDRRWLDTGTVFLNRCDYLDPALAWTGVKDSGRGCTLSRVGFEQLTRPKSLPITGSRHERRTQGRLEFPDDDLGRARAHRGAAGGVPAGRASTGRCSSPTRALLPAQWCGAAAAAARWRAGIRRRAGQPDRRARRGGAGRLPRRPARRRGRLRRRRGAGYAARSSPSCRGRRVRCGTSRTSATGGRGPMWPASRRWLPSRPPPAPAPRSAARASSSTSRRTRRRSSSTRR